VGGREEGKIGNPGHCVKGKKRGRRSPLRSKSLLSPGKKEFGGGIMGFMHRLDEGEERKIVSKKPCILIVFGRKRWAAQH